MRESHELPLAFFESLLFISRTPRGSMRVGDLARELRVTVGGTSKPVDRIERAGLIAREPDPDDRRASRVALTTAGKRKLTGALKTYEAEVAGILGGRDHACGRATCAGSRNARRSPARKREASGGARTRAAARYLSLR